MYTIWDQELVFAGDIAHSHHQHSVSQFKADSLNLPTDYVRTFTLDKRLEMYLKKTAGRVLPTIVWPELYRKRFCAAMEQYFTVVPDKWAGFGPLIHCEALDKAG